MNTKIPVFAIPVLNRGDLLERLVESLDFPIKRLLIINNGNDDTVRSAIHRIRNRAITSDIIEQVDVYEPGHNLGVAPSWNKVMQLYPSAPYWMICANDMFFHRKGDLEKMFMYAEANHSSQAMFYADGYSCFCMTQLGLQQVGKFDENIYPAYVEDSDHFYRVRLTGAVTNQFPDIEMTHGEGKQNGSCTIKSNKKYEIANTATQKSNFKYYIKKWGGLPNYEIYRTPFNNPNKAADFWELDTERRRFHDLIWNRETSDASLPDGQASLLGMAIPPKKKKSMLIVGEYKINTGFSQVVTNLVKQLEKEYYITVLDDYKMFRSVDGMVMVYGKQDEKDDGAIRQLLLIYKSFDKLFFVNDIWNINIMLKAIKDHCYKIDCSINELPQISVYFPVDADQHNPQWFKNFDIVTHGVTYTQYAKRVVTEANPRIGPVMKIMPHGFDPHTFHRLPESKTMLRQIFFGTAKYNESFIFLNANRNQTRKKQDISIDAFKMFLDATGPTDAKLYFHCGIVDRFIDIHEGCRRAGIMDHVILLHGQANIQNISKETMNMVYNISDVGINSSIGEGWGLTNTEAAALGIPQIVPKHSACEELFEGCGPLVACTHKETIADFMTVGQVPNAIDMAAAMMKLYEDKKYYQECAAKCKAKFGDPSFHWSAVAKRWVNEVFEFSV